MAGGVCGGGTALDGYIFAPRQQNTIASHGAEIRVHGNLLAWHRRTSDPRGVYELDDNLSQHAQDRLMSDELYSFGIAYDPMMLPGIEDPQVRGLEAISPYASPDPGARSDSSDMCGQCGTRFTGKYRKGNLRRHMANSCPNSADDSKKDKRCRECKTSFQRGDAKRKHEWRKHRIWDARPRNGRSGELIRYE